MSISILDTVCYCKNLPNDSRCDFCTGMRTAGLAALDSVLSKEALKAAQEFAIKFKFQTAVVWNENTGRFEIAPSKIVDLKHHYTAWIIEPNGDWREGPLSAYKPTRDTCGM